MPFSFSCTRDGMESIGRIQVEWNERTSEMALSWVGHGQIESRAPFRLLLRSYPNLFISTSMSTNLKSWVLGERKG